MSQHTADPAHSTLTQNIARAVEQVPGVAFLRPGLGGRLRSVLTRAEAGPLLGAGAAAGEGRGVGAGAGWGSSGASGSSAGVRLVRPGGGAGPWQVEIHLVARRQARTVDVARAARRTVQDHLAMALPAEAGRARVTVTVTGLV
ncbi:hypothetical protein ACFWNK_19230 [Streptomyces sp. NPDC058417]|uniref:hypothetical protein n=1 Tax=unclassified Streptomyces TaxID=2593676 RepID=UPI003664E280